MSIGGLVSAGRCCSSNWKSMSFVSLTLTRCEPLQVNEDFSNKGSEPQGEGGGGFLPPPHFFGTDGHIFLVGLVPLQRLVLGCTPPFPPSSPVTLEFDCI